MTISGGLEPGCGFAGDLRSQLAAAISRGPAQGALSSSGCLLEASHSFLPQGLGVGARKSWPFPWLPSEPGPHRRESLGLAASRGGDCRRWATWGTACHRPLTELDTAAQRESDSFKVTVKCPSWCSSPGFGVDRMPSHWAPSGRQARPGPPRLRPACARPACPAHPPEGRAPASVPGAQPLGSPVTALWVGRHLTAGTPRPREVQEQCRTGAERACAPGGCTGASAWVGGGLQLAPTSDSGGRLRGLAVAEQGRLRRRWL